MRKNILLSILITFLSFLITGVGNALNIPFISSHTNYKDLTNNGSMSFNINGDSYNINVGNNQNSNCDRLLILNGHLACEIDIGGDKFFSNGIIYDDKKINTLKSNSDGIIETEIDINGEKYNNQLQKKLLSIYSYSTNKIGGHTYDDFVEKEYFNKEIENIDEKIENLKNNYIDTNELKTFPLNSKGEYCDIDNDDDCSIQYIKFLKKDPINKKINLDLLIGY